MTLLDACTVDGRIYCAPVNIHSWQWLWVSHKAFEDASLSVPTNLDEFAAGAGALEAAGKVPLVIYFVSGRLFVRGIAAGAVKG